MALDRQFIKADVKEIKPNIWRVVMTYAYYSLYQFRETFIESSVNDAIKRVARERCHGELQVINHAGVIIE